MDSTFFQFVRTVSSLKCSLGSVSALCDAACQSGSPSLMRNVRAELDRAFENISSHIESFNQKKSENVAPTSEKK